VVRPTRKTERERMKVGEGAVGGGRTREKSYVECSKAAKSAIFQCARKLESSKRRCSFFPFVEKFFYPPLAHD
jgi:hypothetical protein